MHRIDGEGATVDNKFTIGNPSTGVPATQVTADWLNAVQEEIIAVLDAAGITPQKTNNAQLVAAIQSLISGGGVAVTASGVTIEDSGGYFTDGDVEAALQQLGEKVYTGTFNASQLRRNVVTVNGASSTQAGHLEALVQVNSATAVNYTVNPDSTYDAPIGSAIQVAQAGAGKVSFVAGAGVTLLKPNAFNAATLGQHAIAVLVKTAANTWRLGGMLEAA